MLEGPANHDILNPLVCQEVGLCIIKGFDPKPLPFPPHVSCMCFVTELSTTPHHGAPYAGLGTAMSEDETIQRAGAVGTRPLLVEFKDSMHIIFARVLGQVRCSARGRTTV